MSNEELKYHLINKKYKLANETDAIKIKKRAISENLKMIYGKQSHFCLNYVNRDRLICAISENASFYKHCL